MSERDSCRSRGEDIRVKRCAYLATEPVKVEAPANHQSDGITLPFFRPASWLEEDVRESSVREREEKAGPPGGARDLMPRPGFSASLPPRTLHVLARRNVKEKEMRAHREGIRVSQRAQGGGRGKRPC